MSPDVKVKLTSSGVRRKFAENPIAVTAGGGENVLFTSRPACGVRVLLATIGLFSHLVDTLGSLAGECGLDLTPINIMEPWFSHLRATVRASGTTCVHF